MKTKKKIGVGSKTDRVSTLKARIVITAFNSHKDLPGCMQALAKQTRSDFEVVIVNNDPDDARFDTYKWPDSRFKSVVSITNSGFSGGSNLGAKGAKTDWIITLNPDTRPAPNWFETLMAAAEAAPDYGMLSSTLITANDESRLDGLGDVYSIFGIAWRSQQGRLVQNLKGGNHEVLSPCGAAAAYKRDVFEQVGGFDSGYFCYLEDVDLGLRLQWLGHKCLHVNLAILRHFGSGSTGKGRTGRGSALALFYTNRNQVRLMLKTVPGILLLISLPAYMFGLVWILFRTHKHPNWNDRVKGVWAGWRLVPDHLRARKSVQKTRKISVWVFAKLLIWSPLALRRKD